MKIFTDKPIENKQDDTLNRSRFADMVADYLLSNTTKDGFVASINGQWGCGKTSLINMIKQDLREYVVTKEKYVMPVFVDFAPWNATDQSQIIKQFLDTLSNSFKEKRVMQVIEKSLKIMSTIVDLAPLPPLIRTAVKSVEKAFGKYKSAIEKVKDNLDTFKNDIVKELSHSYVRYIVFIDDIDRLNDEEIKLLIQLIKSICNFPNVTYVLSYDKEIIAGALNNAQSNVDGYKYLEKIVQMEFNVPNIKESRMKQITYSDLLDAIGDIKEKDIQNIRTYIGFGMFSQLTNIREEKRYINNLIFAIQCNKDEIDIADLCAITYLRSIDENIFKLILEYRDYIFGNSQSKDSNSVRIVSEAFFKKLDETKYIRAKNKFLLSHMFPSMFNTMQLIRVDRVETKRLCNENKFNSYLQFELDDNDIPAERLDAVLELDNVESLFNLAKDLTAEQVITFIHSLEDLTMNLVDPEKFKVVMLFAFNYMSLLHKADGDYEYLKESVIRVVCTHMIQNIGQNLSRDILKEVVNQTSNCMSLISFYTLITERSDDGSILTAFDSSFKNFVFEKAKKYTILQLREDESSTFFDSYGLVSFLLNNCKNELIEVLKTKSNEWLCEFITSTIYRGYSVSKTTSYCYSYDEDLLTLIKSNTKIDIGCLKNYAKTNKQKQRIIAVEMQFKKVPFTKGKNYYCSDIRSYCKENKIGFIPSDLYEEVK